MTTSVTAKDRQEVIHAAIECAALPYRPYDTKKAVIHRASRVLGVPFERLRKLFYGRATPTWEEVETIKKRAAQHAVRMEWQFLATDGRQAALAAEGDRIHALRRGGAVGSLGGDPPVRR